MNRPVHVLVAMSGGVDSSVAAALELEAGHQVTGCTMRLWGGDSDTGCCSVADVDDARRVAQQLGIDHFVFNFGDDFEAAVVGPYVAAHAAGHTPNPCVECNRSLKFERLLARAHALGFDALATGHHARSELVGGRWRLRRGVDRAKDQSYVLHMLGQDHLARTRFPVGHLDKAEVRRRAAAMGLRTAAKPDSQDVCFITSTGGRASFVGARTPLTEGRVVDLHGAEVGRVAAVELVTVGQRRGLGLAGGGGPRYAVAVDVAGGRVTVGGLDDLGTTEVGVASLSWVDRPVDGAVLVQTSAHGTVRPATYDGESSLVRFTEPTTRVAPGQSVVLYHGDEVLGGGLAVASCEFGSLSNPWSGSET
ncbi:MAG TPA: tRNA 2-thiouridine(34) synthase MnmA [Acidimicrobiales bacterium]|nr:tRNA 2-thiouridine(34) synthase MnmA [Acidimicrobiales bacterium]